MKRIKQILIVFILIFGYTQNTIASGLEKNPNCFYSGTYKTYSGSNFLFFFRVKVTKASDPRLLSEMMAFRATEFQKYEDISKEVSARIDDGSALLVFKYIYYNDLFILSNQELDHLEQSAWVVVHTSDLDNELFQDQSIIYSTSLSLSYAQPALKSCMKF